MIVSIMGWRPIEELGQDDEVHCDVVFPGGKDLMVDILIKE